MRKNSIKNTRINGEVQKELGRIISQEIKDPRIQPMTSVVNVEVAPDLKHAKVYISVLGNEEEREATCQGLRSAAPYIRSLLAKSINLRNTPELHFVIDQSIEYGINMSRLIDDINAKNTKQAEFEDEYEDEDEYDDEDEYEDDDEESEDETEKE